MQLELHLDDRQCDRVYVTVCLTPEGGSAVVHGVAVELRTRQGEPLSARLMLPISGPLPAPLALRTEVRARTDLPRGARLHGVVWSSEGSLESSCPTDPGTTLEAYAYGSPIGLGTPDPLKGPHDLTDDERASLVRAYPWMGRYASPARVEDSQVIEEQPQDLAADIAASYGLSDEDRSFLEELLADDDEAEGADWSTDGWTDDAWDEVGDDLGDVGA